MARQLAVSAALLLLLLACHQAAAWQGKGCEDKVVGQSKVFGVVGENKPMEKVDHTDAWRQHGQITKINLYYSWNYGCLQGLKATYGYKAADALIIGHQKNLYTQDIQLADYEHVVKADIRQQPGKCIEFIKLYTSKGRSISFGSAKSTAPSTTVKAPEGAFLAAFKGEHDIEAKGDTKVIGGLQNIQFVWAEEVCPPAPAQEASPAPPAAPEVITPLEGEAEEEPATMPNPSAPPTAPEAPEPPVCPAAPAMCDEAASEGAANFCPVTAPFTEPECVGGCCASSGKCRLPLCKLNGLGADVMALDFICYGKNQGPFGGLNKCRNLACKLAVPGCKTTLLGGNCVGTVAAVNDDVDQSAKGYVGKPCLEVVNTPGPLHLPLNKPGMPSAGGEFVGGLWSVCDCEASPSVVLPAVPVLDLKKRLLGPKLALFRALLAGGGAARAGAAAGSACQGPLCALLPQLPVMNATLPDLQIPMTLLANLTALLKPQPIDGQLLAGLVPRIQLPQIRVEDFNLTLPDLPTFDQCAGYFANVTSLLRPAIEAALPTREPLPQSDLSKVVSSLLPQIRFELPQLDLVNIKGPQLQLSDLTNLVSALMPKALQAPIHLPSIQLPEVLLSTSKATADKVAADKAAGFSP